jgi:PAS domain S-box-containing protein
MIPTQGHKIWLGAAALLALWALLAWLSLARLAEFEALQAARDRSRAIATLLRESTRALADMESGNRAFFLAASERARLPFDTGRASLIRSYKQLEIQYRGDKKSLNELRGFKKPLNRWFALSNPAIAQRRAAGASPDNALLSRLARSEEERAGVMQNARDILIGLSNAQEKRAESLAAQQATGRLAVRSMTLATIGVGVFGIAGLAMLLARQAVRIGESNESLRREVESRRRAERERQILANHDEQILNSTIEGIVALNVKGRVTFVNPSAAAMLGWEVPELLGKPWHDMAQHSRADNVRLDKELSPVLATLRDATARRISDDVFWKRTGKNFPVEYAVNPLWELSPRENEDRQLSGATVTFRDITERKRSEIALLRLASVVESSKDAILSHLLDGTIVSCNASAVKMYGYSAREMEGQSLAVLFPPARAEEARLSPSTSSAASASSHTRPCCWPKAAAKSTWRSPSTPSATPAAT